MSREQRLEAALRNAHAFIWNVVPVPGSLLSDKKRATLQAIAAVLGEQEATPECTGLAATWCPIHGDCTCRPHGDGMADHKDDPTCPLHAPSSPHGESVGEQEATPPDPGVYKPGVGYLPASALPEPRDEWRVVDDARIFCVVGYDDVDAAHADAEMLDRENPLARHHVERAVVAWMREPDRPASAPQGEPEPSDDQPKVIESWLRWNDVECVRCHRMAGWEGERCYVVDVGVICDGCVTDAEKARAVPQR